MLSKNVLRRKSDFSKIYSKGKSVADRYVVVFYKKNNLGYCRWAYLASKKVGNSVMRNRARRLLKESMRSIDLPLPDSFDYIIIARNTICNAKCQDVSKSLKSAFKRTGVIRNNEIH